MILSIDYYPVGITLIISASILSVVGLRFLKKFIPHSRFITLEDSAGTFLQVIGTLYAVLLGFIVTDAIEKYMDAEKNIVGEAAAIVAIYELSNQVVPVERRHLIQKNTSEYLDEILASDWHHMENDTDNFQARRKLRSLLQAIQSIEPVSENNKAIFPILIDRILEATDLRRLRVDCAKEGIPHAEWICLLIGTFATVLSGYFLRIKNRWAHELCILLMMFVACTNLYAVLLFGEPYKGQFLASKQPLVTAKKVMDGSYFGVD